MKQLRTTSFARKGGGKRTTGVTSSSITSNQVCNDIWHNELEMNINVVTCFALPNRSDILSDVLWCEKIGKLKSLVCERLNAQVSKRNRNKAAISRRTWCHLARGVVYDFNGKFVLYFIVCQLFI